MIPSIFTQKSHEYQRVENRGEVYLPNSRGSDREDSEPRHQHVHMHAVLRWHSIYILWFNIALFLASCTMFILSLRPQAPPYTDHKEQLRNHYLKHVSMPSPILDETDIRVSPKRMAATLLNTNPPSIYRREANPEVDHAWQSLYDTRPVALTRAQVLAVGQDPSSAVRIPSSWGQGNDSYFGRLDVFHQMHCLDNLRREVYYSKQHPGGLNTTSELHRLHTSHCFWLLAQNIMCSANTDVYTHVWTDTLEHPFPDFNIDHQCKNYDAVMEWQQRNALDERAFVDLRRPEGYPYRTTTHKFKELHDWFKEHEDDGDFETGEIV